ncbi:sugar transferase [Halomonas rhizosphaerae]|uniref:Sugar transferase n=1 Tax=Halomonas rhizosphaerae TaxID=3043296 RepID=A0ABT6V1Q1_9GAMM|nr:sugar transferase [Halomonas rhizosphaerae]MDI5891851.1 sugar transferase [Halomonas rhizosphaerae]
MMDTSHYERRHSRWYEQLLLGLPFQLLGLLVVLLLPGLERWGWEFWLRLQETHSNTLIAIAFSFISSVLTQRRMSRFPGAHIAAYILPTVTSMFMLSVAFLFFTREGYSRQVLFEGYLLTLVWCFGGYFLGRRFRQLKIAMVPLGEASNLASLNGIDIRPLLGPKLEGVRYDGVVADLRSPELTPEWERFLARCTLNRIPVYHVKQLSESLTGRVQIDHLAENEFGTLLPNPLYAGFKRLIDMFAVLLTLPITLPLMLLTAIAVKVDSPGPVLFTQQRVGQGNRNYTIYKFRSMCEDSEKEGAQFAQAGDMRVTRVGRVIRKSRLDELPQFINVLKGDMSLIGPRPEQRAFVEQFEEEIPFYIYRHVVKPGISGWAQVVQGYASDADDTRVKVQHDFYYIKHFSLWLDVLIVFKTLKTILTGFGAR